MQNINKIFLIYFFYLIIKNKMLNINNHLQIIRTQLSNLEIQFDNINMQIINMKLIPNISFQIQNLGIQMLNMGIQMINIGIDIPDFGMQMSNLYHQIQNIDMQIQNIATKICMKNNMQVNMNMQMMNNKINDINIMDDNDSWNLIFERKATMEKINIIISPEKTIQDAINLYKIKSGNNKEGLKFIFNSRQLYPNRKICESGLVEKANILVIDTDNIIGGKKNLY